MPDRGDSQKPPLSSSGIVDFGAVAKQAAEHVAVRVLDALPAVVRAELQRRDTDRLLDTKALAAHLGITAKALRARLSRGSGLAPLALDLDGRRCWRKSDVDAHLAQSGSVRR